MRVLVAEDDSRTADYLVKGLGESGHIVDRVGDGLAALAMALEGIYDALVLDRKLPELDGLTVVRRMRRRGLRTPVLMLSGTATTADRVEGLQAGCDDYLAKPYSVCRVAGAARGARPGRRPHAQGHRAAGRRSQLDTAGRTVSRGGRAIELQRREFLLLEQLVRHAGEIVTRSMLLEAAWPYDFEPRGNIVDMHIHRLRQKIDDGFPSRLIQTVVGAGYTIRFPAAVAAGSAEETPKK